MVAVPAINTGGLESFESEIALNEMVVFGDGEGDGASYVAIGARELVPGAEGFQLLNRRPDATEGEAAIVKGNERGWFDVRELEMGVGEFMAEMLLAPFCHCRAPAELVRAGGEDHDGEVLGIEAKRFGCARRRAVVDFVGFCPLGRVVVDYAVEVKAEDWFGHGVSFQVEGLEIGELVCPSDLVGAVGLDYADPGVGVDVDGFFVVKSGPGDGD